MGQIEPPIVAIDLLQPTLLGIAEELRPDRLAFAHHDGIGMTGRLIGQRGHVQPTQDHRHLSRTVAVGQFVALLHLRAEAGDGDQVEAVGKLAQLADIVNFEIFALMFRRRGAGQSEQSQAGQRGDGFAALDEARQRQAEFQQLGVAGADSAHGNQSDFHRMSPR